MLKFVILVILAGSSLKWISNVSIISTWKEMSNTVFDKKNATGDIYKACTERVFEIS